MTRCKSRTAITCRRVRSAGSGICAGLWGRPGILVNLTVIALVLLISLPSSAASESSPYAGITIIELTDEQASDILKGRGQSGGTHIVAFVSDVGSYASLLREEQQRLCIAWAEAGSGADGSIIFGLPPSRQSLGLVYPEICMPFTLTFTDEDRIRLVADNPYSKKRGPLIKQAVKVHYEGEHRVIARIPLVSIDWEMPLFSRYTVNDIMVGPLQTGQSQDLSLRRLNRLPAGTWQTLVTRQDPSGSAETSEVMGGVITKDVFGWPWDLLYAVYTEKHLEKVIQTDIFDQAVLERYGTPTAAVTGMPNYTKEFYWLFDLQGNQVTALGQDNCSATFDFWKQEDNLAVFDKDIGPWGCSLVMMLSHNGFGARPRVSTWDNQAVSGHALASYHFKSRVEEAEAARIKIETVQSFRPQL